MKLQKYKEGKSKMIASRGSLEEHLREYRKEEGATTADRVDLRTRVENL